MPTAMTSVSPETESPKWIPGNGAGFATAPKMRPVSMSIEGGHQNPPPELTLLFPDRSLGV